MANNLKTKKDTVDSRDPPDIFKAAKNDDVAEMEAARRDGQSLKDLDALGLTPVHVAAIDGSLNFVRAAVRTGEVDPWIRDGNQRLAVEHAAAFNRIEIQEILINAMYSDMDLTSGEVLNFPEPGSN